MAYKKSLSLLSWVFLQPLKISVISLLFLLFFVLLAGIIMPGVQGAITTYCTILAISISAYITIYKMPRENMDRQGFIALNNTHYLISSTIFFIVITILTKYKDVITYKLMLLGTNLTPKLMILMLLAALLFLYLVATFVVNLYAKYLRCREMGISTWKIICSMPFGFSLLWTPGYLLESETKNNSAVSIHSNWYLKLTKFVGSKYIYTLLTFILLTIYSGFFYGPQMVILTLIYLLIFTIWLKISGLSTFRQQQNRIYSYLAIIMNVLIIIGLITYTSMSAQPDVTINISDTITTPTAG